MHQQLATDEELLARYRTGDREAFAELVGRYQLELFHFLMRFLGKRAAAEDVFQETFLQVHLAADQFDVQRRFKPWLFAIAVNKARDHLRRRSERPAAELSTRMDGQQGEGPALLDLLQTSFPGPDQLAENEELRRNVQQVVAGMPEHLRQVLVLAYFHSQPYRDIAEQLGVPLGTVKSRLHAAVATFAQLWKHHTGHEA